MNLSEYSTSTNSLANRIVSIYPLQPCYLVNVARILYEYYEISLRYVALIHPGYDIPSDHGRPNLINTGLSGTLIGDVSIMTDSRLPMKSITQRGDDSMEHLCHGSMIHGCRKSRTANQYEAL